MIPLIIFYIPAALLFALASLGCFHFASQPFLAEKSAFLVGLLGILLALMAIAAVYLGVKGFGT